MFTVDKPEGESKSERKLRKEAEKLAESRPLDPWERYRALNDLVDHMLDVIEMADRRTRFALVVVGALNAANILIALRADLIGATALDPLLVRAYVGCYLLLSLYFLVHAVIALKPRSRQLGRGQDTATVPGIRLVDDILSHTPDDFYELWRTSGVGALNRELAMQVHLMAQTTSEKYAALRKVYAGVLILIVLTAVFVGVLGVHAVVPSLL